jgi:hypothetical protein
MVCSRACRPPYFDWKRGLNDDYGLSLGVYLYALYQQANSSLASSDDDAFGNIFRFMGSWTVFQKDNGNLGRIEYRVESRSNFGSFQAPGSLGSAVGVASLAPGFGYSENFDLDLSVLNWTQGFNDGRAGFAVGRLGFDAYLDAFPFQSTSRGFLNRSFVLNPTMATTGIGAIGGVVKGFVTDKIWLGAQMYDANAASGDFDFDTAQEGEWLKAVEIGYTPSFGQRKSQLVQFTYWEKAGRYVQGQRLGGQLGMETQRPNISVRSFWTFGWRRWCCGGRCYQRRRRNYAKFRSGLDRRSRMGKTVTRDFRTWSRRRNCPRDVLQIPAIEKFLAHARCAGYFQSCERSRSKFGVGCRIARDSNDVGTVCHSGMQEVNQITRCQRILADS